MAMYATPELLVALGKGKKEFVLGCAGGGELHVGLGSKFTLKQAKNECDVDEEGSINHCWYFSEEDEADVLAFGAKKGLWVPEH